MHNTVGTSCPSFLPQPASVALTVSASQDVPMSYRTVYHVFHVPSESHAYFLRYLGRAGVDGDRLAKHLRARRGPTHPRAPSAEDNASLV